MKRAELLGAAAQIDPRLTADSLKLLIPSARYKLNPASVANPIFDTTPTHFFDPYATASAATGTLANPFNTLAQVENYFNTTLSGLAFGKVLGMKRGTSVRGKLELLVTGYSNSGGGRRDDNPFMIVPYGSAQSAPIIECSIQVGGSATPKWSYDGAFWFYDTGNSREVDAFQDGRRIYKRTNRANALTAGPGFSYWSGTTVYVLPYTNASDLNSIATLVEVQSAFGAIATNLGHGVLARYRNQARTGNIIIAGIQCNKPINSCVSIQSASSFGTIATVDTLQVIGCISNDSGVDQTSVGAGCDGIVITGVSDAIRASNVYAGGNSAINCLNNAIELNGVSGYLAEWNTSIGCGGNSVLELYASCSNGSARYNFGFGAGVTQALTNASTYNGSGYWLPGYIWDQVTPGNVTANTDVTRNVNNDVYFNVAINNRSVALQYEAGTGGKIVNNVWHTIGVVNGSPNGAPSAMLGTNSLMALPSSIEFSNNVVLNGGQDNLTMQVGKISGATRNCALTGDGNFYWNTASGYGQNNTISTVNNAGGTVAASNLTYTNIESWTAGFAAGGNTIDTNGRMNDPKVNLANGMPTFGSPIMARRPVMPAGFYCDLAGKPLMSSFPGAYQL